MQENYFLSYILNNKYYNDKFLPSYLRPENYEQIKQNLNKIEIVTDSCSNYFDAMKDNTISMFNFSNIFEWISPEEYENLLKDTVRVAKDGAILTYRNLLVFRERPNSLKGTIISLPELSESLHKIDLSFIYNNYVVEQIHKG